MQVRVALLLALLIATASPPILVGATTTTPVDQVWTRHAPIVGNLTLTPEELEKILGSILNTTVADPRLAEILGDMNASLATGDAEGYNNASARLQEYLTRLSQEGQPIDIALDPAMLEKLALLASTTMQDGTEANADLNLYASFLEQLMESGLLGEAEPLGGEITQQDIQQTLESMGLDTSRAAQEETPIDVAKSPPPLPSASLPSAPSISTQGIKLQLMTVFKIVALFAALLVVSYLAYINRHKLLQVTESITSRVTARAKTWAAQRARTPREAVIRCFEALVSAAARLGYPKNRWETAREYAARLVSKGLGPLALKVAKLYEKARFSNHEVTWKDVEECVSCVREVASR